MVRNRSLSMLCVVAIVGLSLMTTQVHGGKEGKGGKGGKGKKEPSGELDWELIDLGVEICLKKMPKARRIVCDWISDVIEGSLAFNENRMASFMDRSPSEVAGRGLSKKYRARTTQLLEGVVNYALAKGDKLKKPEQLEDFFLANFNEWYMNVALDSDNWSPHFGGNDPENPTDDWRAPTFEEKSDSLEDLVDNGTLQERSMLIAKAQMDDIEAGVSKEDVQRKLSMGVYDQLVERLLEERKWKRGELDDSDDEDEDEARWHWVMQRKEKHATQTIDDAEGVVEEQEEKEEKEEKEDREL